MKIDDWESVGALVASVLFVGFSALSALVGSVIFHLAIRGAVISASIGSAIFQAPLLTAAACGGAEDEALVVACVFVCIIGLMLGTIASFNQAAEALAVD